MHPNKTNNNFQNLVSVNIMNKNNIKEAAQMTINRLMAVLIYSLTANEYIVYPTNMTNITHKAKYTKQLVSLKTKNVMKWQKQRVKTMYITKFIGNSYIAFTNKQRRINIKHMIPVAIANPYQFLQLAQNFFSK